MFGNVVRGIEGKRFEDEIKRVKSDRGVKDDTELDVEALQELTRSFKELYEFPTDPREQLEQAIRAVFDSWNGERAVDLPAHQPHPRRLGHGGQRAADGLRQQGRRAAARASPSAATRSPARRSPAATSSSTPRARTSSRACATRSTSPSSTGCCPTVHAQLMEILRELERHYGDMQDTEFTVEEGRLYMLQTRNAKRPAQAAVRFAVDAVERGPARQGPGAADDRPRDPRRAAAPDLRPAGRVRRAGLRRGRLAGRGDRRDRLHRRRRGGRRRPTGAT